MSIIPIIYHNPRCSKSRQVLAWLIENDFDPTVIDYLKTPPSFSELKCIHSMLNIPVRDMLRKKEAEYKTFNLDDQKLTDKEILKIVTQHPILIERPIVMVNKKAAIIRPLEVIHELISIK